jgi:cation diffusion facilitator CzcD-associated flavoprotein CzcO
MTCGFLFLCTGYYRYDEGHTPEFPGRERFAGPVVHPQHWPQDLDVTGRRVVVIGSGATAVTLVPALAESAAHVTMLQRTPTYIVAVPARDPLAVLARRLLPERAAYGLVRWKNVLLTMLVFGLSRRRPGLVRRLVLRGVRDQLPQADLRRDFTPPYDPWDQRMCVVPDGDLFRAIRDGRASIVTDTIETFTERGIRLAGGREVEADVIVTATGLELLSAGGMALEVDGEEVRIPERVTYKSMMLSDVPNLAIAMGYTNASWTLKADLTSEFVCRVLNRMREEEATMAVAPLPPGLPTEPIITLSAGYVQRSLHLFPRQGRALPWRVHQNYARDIAYIRHGPIEDGTLELSAPDRVGIDRVPAAA